MFADDGVPPAAPFSQAQIVRLPEDGVDEDHDYAGGEGSDEVVGGVGKEQSDDRHHREHQQHQPICDCPPEDHQRLVPQEIQEQPGGHHDREHDERDRVPEQAEEDDHQDDDGVVHGEVPAVGPDPDVGVPEARGDAEGVPVDHLLPWPPRLQSSPHRLLLA